MHFFTQQWWREVATTGGAGERVIYNRRGRGESEVIYMLGVEDVPSLNLTLKKGISSRHANARGNPKEDCRYLTSVIKDLYMMETFGLRGWQCKLLHICFCNGNFSRFWFQKGYKYLLALFHCGQARRLWLPLLSTKAQGRMNQQNTNYRSCQLFSSRVRGGSRPE